jgi:hypothetical protein
MIICDACKDIVTENPQTAFGKHYCTKCITKLLKAWDKEEEKITNDSATMNRVKLESKPKEVKQTV